VNHQSHMQIHTQDHVQFSARDIADIPARKLTCNFILARETDELYRNCMQSSNRANDVLPCNLNRNCLRGAIVLRG